MRLTFLCTSLQAAITLMAASAFGQAPGTITTVGGNGNFGNSGDGGPPTKAPLGAAHGVVVDKVGNSYIEDAIFSIVRTVDARGIISTFARGNPNALGDDCPATKASLALGPVFHAGNLHIANTGDSRVRKVDTSGTITTVAGNRTNLGIGSFSGDGGPATGATGANALAEDAQTDGKPSRVVKVLSYRFLSLMEEWRQT